MDILLIAILVLVVLAALGAGFAFMRGRQRSGTVLATPETSRKARR